jgi:hypothetical protein
MRRVTGGVLMKKLDFNLISFTCVCHEVAGTMEIPPPSPYCHSSLTSQEYFASNDKSWA